MKIKYLSDHYNALNYCIHKIKHKSYLSKEHAGNKETQSIRITL